MTDRDAALQLCRDYLAGNGDDAVWQSKRMRYAVAQLVAEQEKEIERLKPLADEALRFPGYDKELGEVGLRTGRLVQAFEAERDQLRAGLAKSLDVAEKSIKFICDLTGQPLSDEWRTKLDELHQLLAPREP